MPERIAQYCKVHLNLQNAELSEEYYYRSLPFCIIDAVFSLAARFSSTRNAVIRCCNFNWTTKYGNTRNQWRTSQSSRPLAVAADFGVMHDENPL